MSIDGWKRRFPRDRGSHCIPTAQHRRGRAPYAQPSTALLVPKICTGVGKLPCYGILAQCCACRMHAESFVSSLGLAWKAVLQNYNFGAIIVSGGVKKPFVICQCWPNSSRLPGLGTIQQLADLVLFKASIWTLSLTPIVDGVDGHVVSERRAHQAGHDGRPLSSPRLKGSVSPVDNVGRVLPAAGSVSPKLTSSPTWTRAYVATRPPALPMTTCEQLA